MRPLPPALMLLALASCASLTHPGQNAKPTYVVFFQERSAVLDADAQSSIAVAARDAKAHPTDTVFVLGYTDSLGSPVADQTLSRQRAQVVADTLVTDGVALDRIRKEGRGQTHDDPGVASRRVEIAIGE